MSSYKLRVCSIVYIGTTHTSNTENYWLKLEVNLPSSTPQRHKDVVDAYDHLFLTSELDGRE